MDQPCVNSHGFITFHCFYCFPTALKKNNAYIVYFNRWVPGPH